MGGFSLKIGENRNMLKKEKKNRKKKGTGHPALLWCSRTTEQSAGTASLFVKWRDLNW